jgi:N-acetylglucosamine-6-phosphate deacetylase
VSRRKTTLKAILASEILTPERIIRDAALLIGGDRLIEVGRPAAELPAECEVFDVSPWRVTPGLIDLHLHGAVGHNVMGPELSAVAAHLPQRGVTSFLPTTLTVGPGDLRAALDQMAQRILKPPAGARPLGIHLEGPHLSPKKAGIAPVRFLRPLTEAVWRELQTAARGTISMLTFAPEEGGAALIPRLINQGVVPSIGHSAATFEQVTEYADLGLRHASHVFNAMGPFHHRAPGVVGAVLYHRSIVAQLIGDLHHVHPAAIELLFRLKGVDHVALVSDAAPVAGLPPGVYQWYAGTRVRVREDGSCHLPDGETLASSTAFLDQAVANLVEVVGLSWPEALQTATAVPGEVLGVKRGRLRAGWIADLTVWDDEFRAIATMVEGRWAWRRGGADRFSV